MSFQVGDRVVQVRRIDGHFGAIGALGTVIATDRDHGGFLRHDIGVEFDAPLRGAHDCEGHGLDGRCFWASSTDVEYATKGSHAPAQTFRDFARVQDLLAATAGTA